MVRFARAMAFGDASALITANAVLVNPIMWPGITGAQFNGDATDPFACTHERYGAGPDLGRIQSWHGSQPSSKAQNSTPSEVTKLRGRSPQTNEACSREQASS